MQRDGESKSCLTCRPGQLLNLQHARNTIHPSSNSSMSSEVTALATAAAEADKVVKKQKVCSNKFASAVDSLLAAVNDSKDRLQNGKTESVLTRLKDHVTQLGIPSELHDQTKQLHQAVAKLGKVSCQNRILLSLNHPAACLQQPA